MKLMPRILLVIFWCYRFCSIYEKRLIRFLQLYNFRGSFPVVLFVKVFSVFDKLLDCFRTIRVHSDIQTLATCFDDYMTLMFHHVACWTFYLQQNVTCVNSLFMFYNLIICQLSLKPYCKIPVRNITSRWKYCW